MAVQLNKRREQNFGLVAEWHFFTARYGKGPADRTGRAVKRLAAKARIQKVYNNQIQMPPELLNYCSSNIYNIKLFYIQEQILNKNKELAAVTFLSTSFTTYKITKNFKSNGTDILVPQMILILSNIAC
jgi:hypothetical protein